MIAVFGETPYQILSGINIAYSEFHDECVLFVMRDMFKTDIKFELQLEDYSGFIKGIYYTERYPSFLESEDKNNFRASSPSYDYRFVFDRIITHKYGNAAMSLYDSYVDNKPKLYHFEEGIGEYLVLDELTNRELLRDVERKYLSIPDLYPGNAVVSIAKSPPISSDSCFLNELNRLFRYRGELNKYKKYIYFGQTLSIDYNNRVFADIEKKCFKLYKKCRLKKQLTIKAHPRNKASYHLGFKNLHTMAPWECVVAELPDIENRVLVSTSSTCLVTPKLLFNKEPYIICTAKLFENELRNVVIKDDYYERLIAFFENVRNIYIRKEKFFIPNNLDELEIAINSSNEKA